MVDSETRKNSLMIFPLALYLLHCVLFDNLKPAKIIHKNLHCSTLSIFFFDASPYRVSFIVPFMRSSYEKTLVVRRVKGYPYHVFMSKSCT